MTLRILVMAMAVCGFLFSSCGKKPKQVKQQTVQIPAVPVTTADSAPPQKVDTSDVFNEFYKDSKGKQLDKTFSMDASSGVDGYMPEFTEDGPYVVQIAAGPSSEGADELATAFKGKGYPAYVAEVQNPTPELSGTYYRVRIGGFARLSEARAFGENILGPANYDYWVDLKANDAVGTGSPAAQAPYSSEGSSYTSSSSEPLYTPSTSPTTDYGASSSTGTTPYDWSTPSTTTPSTEPSATTPSTTPNWSSESYAPEETSTPPADTGWGGSGWK